MEKKAGLAPDMAPIAVLVAMPLMMASFSREWLYTVIGFLDPWYNIGFFLYYHDNTFLADHYKLQRLPWILPGWMLYHVFGHVIGGLVLHVGTLIVSTVFVYLTLARLVTRQSAFLVASFLTIYIPFHGVGGWDYQAAGSAAYYSIALYLVVRAAQAQDPRNGLIAAGIAYAGALFSTIQLVNFLPALAALYFVAGSRHRTREGIRTALLYSLLGFVGLTLALCVINLAVGRGPFFFWPLLKIVLERVADPVGQKPWLLPWSAFFAPPVDFLYLVLPGVILVASTLRLAASVLGIARLNSFRTWLLGQYVFIGLLWALWQQLGHTALYPGIFAQALVVPAFLSLGGLLGGSPTLRVSVAPAVMAGGFLLAVVPALQGVLANKTAQLIQEISETDGVLGVGLLAAFVAFVPLLFRGPRAAAIVIASVGVFSFGFLQAESNWRKVPALGTLGERYSTRPGCIAHEQTYLEIVKLIKTLRSENPILWQTWLWRGPKGKQSFSEGCIVDLDSLRGSTHSTGISNLGSANDTHPSQITDEYMKYVVDGGLVVAMVKDETDANGLVERFAAAGKKLAFVWRGTMNLGKVPVMVVVYRSGKAN